MTESILDTIKKLLGLDPEYTVFDTDIIVYINSTLMTLNQLGVGIDPEFQVSSNRDTWRDFLGPDVKDQQALPTYVYLKVRLLFDPPASSFGQEALRKQAEEFEWRLNVQSDEFEKESGIS